jgi:CheY-like chemotaxis protein
MLRPKMMTNQSMAWDTFEQHVQACLTHLYDYSFLQSNPLVHLLVPDQTGPDRVDAFRTIVHEAIERLRPGLPVAFHSKAARTYNILSMRYVVQQQTAEVIKQLALSERQFYRDHPKAIHSLSGILWERVTGTIAPETVDAVSLSMQSEVQSLSEHSVRESIDLVGLVEGAVGSMQPLAVQHGVNLIFTVPAAQPMIETHRTLLRQLIMTLLLPLVTDAGNAVELHVTLESIGNRQQIAFNLTDLAIDPETLLSTLHDQETLQHLLKALHSVLRYPSTPPDVMRILLEISSGERTILIVDDNPDAIDLFQRYLVAQPYRLQVAHNGTEAIQLARELQPDVIILDIMLPGQDGLEVLQNLKNHDLTRHIPILVCSILDMQPLAASLGAEDYLRKPPGQDDLLLKLDRWTA